MLKILLLTLLLLTLQAKLLQHHLRTHLTACPKTYIYDSSQTKCVCPSDKPFVTADNRCVQCEGTHFWNSTNQQCETCPIYSRYDTATQTCLGCPNELILYSDTNLCGCPLERPYIDNNEHCVACPSPGYWNTE
jgi:hypothetical protein